VLSRANSSGSRSRALLLTKPRWLFLERVDFGVDEGQEFALYRSLRAALPGLHRGQRQSPRHRRAHTTRGW